MPDGCDPSPPDSREPVPGHGPGREHPRPAVHSPTHPGVEAAFRALLRLAEAAQLGERWATTADGTDALHRALAARGATHLNDLSASELRELAAQAWQAATDDLAAAQS